MRSFARLAGALLWALALTACAQTRFQETQLDSAEAAIRANNQPEAARILSAYLADQNPDGARARAILASNAGFRTQFTALIAKQLEEENSYISLGRRLRDIRAMQQAGALSAEEVAALVQKGNSVAAEGNLNDRYRFDLSDDLSEFPVLEQPEHRRRIFDRSIDYVKGEYKYGVTSVGRALFKEASKRGPGSYEWESLRKALPDMSITTEVWREHGAAVYPEEARRALEQREVRVHLETSPPDRLLTEDLRDKLRKKSANISIVDSDKAQVRVTVSRLQWDEQRKAPSSQTIMYAQHQVNLLGAVLLMPRNASYLYEVTTGGVDLSYAFEIKAHGERIAPFDRLIRERESRGWSQCANARIQNVFGGVQPASFVANDHQVSTCSGSGTQISSDELRSSALDKVVSAIESIEPIKKAIALK
ncbi:hypothetical protein STAQ_28070 [Allostella sp. ATCC 35155]|nr:hypothetical protein STAQ_28070 [Stella sp. ATCC 35155]